MLAILRQRLPAGEPTLRAALAQYRVDLEVHKTTEGVAAPWPAFEILRQIVDAGGDFIVVEDPAQEEEAVTPERERALLTAAVQGFLDNKARAMGYDNIFTAATYADEPVVPQFQAEGRALRAWRSLVWEKCNEVLAAVLAGERAIPTSPELLAEMPAFSL